MSQIIPSTPVTAHIITDGGIPHCGSLARHPLSQYKQEQEQAGERQCACADSGGSVLSLDQHVALVAVMAAATARGSVSAVTWGDRLIYGQDQAYPGATVHKMFAVGEV